MSNEDIIKTIETGMKCVEKDCYFDCENCDLDMPDGAFGQALRTAIALLRTHPDVQPNEPQGDGWISVEDALPKPFEDVLACCQLSDDSGPVIDVSFVYHNGEWCGGDKGVITHWRPLPDPPKEDER